MTGKYEGPRARRRSPSYVEAQSKCYIHDAIQRHQASLGNRFFSDLVLLNNSFGYGKRKRPLIG